MKTVFYAAVLTGLFACFLTWLLMVDTSSPLQSYLLHNPGLGNAWARLISPVLGVSLLLGLPPSDFILYPLVFLQWFVPIALSGFLILSLREKFRNANR